MINAEQLNALKIYLLENYKPRVKRQASDACVAPKVFLNCGIQTLKIKEIPKPEATFQQKLFALIDKYGYKDADIYKRAEMTKQTFSNIRCDESYTPSKNTVFALCIALRLDIDESLDLLNSASFIFSRSNITDLTIKWCIENKIYDLIEVNDYLIQNNRKPITKY